MVQQRPDLLHRPTKSGNLHSEHSLTGLFGVLEDLSDVDDHSDSGNDFNGQSSRTVLPLASQHKKLGSDSRIQIKLCEAPTSAPSYAGRRPSRKRKSLRSEDESSITAQRKKRPRLLSPDSEPEVWPKALRQRCLNAHNKEQRRQRRLAELRREDRRYSVYRSRHWELDHGRLCSSAFRGRSDLVLLDRPHLSHNSPPEVWVRELKRRKYDFVEVK